MMIKHRLLWWLLLLSCVLLLCVSAFYVRFETPLFENMELRTVRAKSALFETTTITATPDPQGNTLPAWRGMRCMPNTELGDPRLGPKCKRRLIAAPFCENISKASSMFNRCGQWAAGRFAPPIRDDLLLSPHFNSSCDFEKFNRVLHANEVYFSDETEPQLKTRLCEGFRYFSSSETIAILRAASGMSSHFLDDIRGRGILFSGDSMMRQVFLRLIAWIRGEPYFSDHYFHNDAIYILKRSSDELISLHSKELVHQYEDLVEAFYPRFFKERHSAKFEMKNIERSDILLVMLYQWDTRPSSFRKEFLDASPVVHVASFMYWWQNKDPLRNIEPYIDTVSEHFSRVSMGLRHLNLSLRSKYIYVTTPWTKPKTFGGVEAHNRIPRNERVARWILEISPGKKLPGIAQMLLDFSGLADARTFTKTFDGIHYMCIWTPKIPESVNNQKENGRGCTDPMNLAVVQWLLHLLHEANRHDQAFG